MSPYIQQALTPALDQMQRQSDIRQRGLSGQAQQAGAYGGYRHGLQLAEGQRNTERNMGDVASQMMNQGFTQAGQLYGTDAARQLQAQQSNQGAGLQSILANQQAQQQTNLANQQGRLSTQALGAGYGAQFGLQNLSNQQQAQLANQAGQYGAQALGAQLGQQGYLQNLANQQQTNLANQQAALGVQQLGSGQNMQAQQLNQAAGLQAQGMGEASRQFGSNLGLQGLNTALQGSGLLGQMGQQQYAQQMGLNQAQQLAGAQIQGLNQQDLTNQYQDFLEAQNWPYKNLSFMSGIMGQPTMNSATSMYQAPASTSQNLMGLGLGAYGLSNMFKKKGGIIRAAKGGRIRGFDVGGLASLNSAPYSFYSGVARNFLEPPRPAPIERASPAIPVPPGAIAPVLAEVLPVLLGSQGGGDASGEGPAGPSPSGQDPGGVAPGDAADAAAAGDAAAGPSPSGQGSDGVAPGDAADAAGAAPGDAGDAGDASGDAGDAGWRHGGRVRHYSSGGILGTMNDVQLAQYAQKGGIDGLMAQKEMGQRGQMRTASQYSQPLPGEPKAEPMSQGVAGMGADPMMGFKDGGIVGFAGGGEAEGWGEAFKRFINDPLGIKDGKEASGKMPVRYPVSDETAKGSTSGLLGWLNDPFGRKAAVTSPDMAFSMEGVNYDPLRHAIDAGEANATLLNTENTGIAQGVQSAAPKKTGSGIASVRAAAPASGISSLTVPTPSAPMTPEEETAAFRRYKSEAQNPEVARLFNKMEGIDDDLAANQKDAMNKAHYAKLAEVGLGMLKPGQGNFWGALGNAGS